MEGSGLNMETVQENPHSKNSIKDNIQRRLRLRMMVKDKNYAPSVNSDNINEQYKIDNSTQIMPMEQISTNSVSQEMPININEQINTFQMFMDNEFINLNTLNIKNEEKTTGNKQNENESNTANNNINEGKKDDKSKVESSEKKEKEIENVKREINENSENEEIKEKNEKEKIDEKNKNEEKQKSVTETEKENIDNKDNDIKNEKSESEKNTENANNIAVSDYINLSPKLDEPLTQSLFFNTSSNNELISDPNCYINFTYPISNEIDKKNNLSEDNPTHSNNEAGQLGNDNLLYTNNNDWYSNNNDDYFTKLTTSNDVNSSWPSDDITNIWINPQKEWNSNIDEDLNNFTKLD